MKQKNEFGLALVTLIRQFIICSTTHDSCENFFFFVAALQWEIRQEKERKKKKNLNPLNTGNNSNRDNSIANINARQDQPTLIFHIIFKQIFKSIFQIHISNILLKRSYSNSDSSLSYTFYRFIKN